MTGQAQRPVGSVAEETARLLEALLGQGGQPGGCRQEPSAPQADAPTAPGPAGETPVTCRLCPVCQLLTVVRSVSPQTLERLADLTAAATEALRALASSRESREPSPGRRGAEVEDIPVGFEDDHDEDRHENEGGDVDG